MHVPLGAALDEEMEGIAHCTLREGPAVDPHLPSVALGLQALLAKGGLIRILRRGVKHEACREQLRCRRQSLRGRCLPQVWRLPLPWWQRFQRKCSETEHCAPHGRKLREKLAEGVTQTLRTESRVVVEGPPADSSQLPEALWIEMPHPNGVQRAAWPPPAPHPCKQWREAVRLGIGRLAVRQKHTDIDASGAQQPHGLQRRCVHARTPRPAADPHLAQMASEVGQAGLLLHLQLVAVVEDCQRPHDVLHADQQPDEHLDSFEHGVESTQRCPRLARGILGTHAARGIHKEDDLKERLRRGNLGGGVVTRPFLAASQSLARLKRNVVCSTRRFHAATGKSTVASAQRGRNTRGRLMAAAFVSRAT
mmetsp:Transcript_71041/g.230166  ORF Transcript_71041/g.230166 Transcript_71041/m.230166 type:complete len:365 (-) Transcript_71041:2-1096(-)